MKTLLLGTRGSQLALAQATWVRNALQRIHGDLEVRVQVIKTTGDRLSRTSLSRLPGGTKGVFVKEIEEALLAGQIDLAIHSLKDLPTDQPRGLALTAIPAREDPRDALVFRVGIENFHELPPAARVGTGSLRRRAQLLHLRPDLNVIEIRGNVDTRLRKLDTERLHAVVLAGAGLRRLGLQHKAQYYFPPQELLPAPGQGALAVETREDDGEVKSLVRPLDCPNTHASVSAERTFLAGLGGGCQLPLGAFAEIQDGVGRLAAFVGSPDGGKFLRREICGPGSKLGDLARDLATWFLEQGARQFFEEKT
ncbi:MAG TPA: hydroxymethylbilane synthase [Acidobacteriota bacterium]|nr:hydroxymethylbilane synthase [Acidobacteriota bacterium]